MSREGGGRVAARLAAFGVVLLLAFGASFGVGRAIGPVDPADGTPHSDRTPHSDQPHTGVEHGS